MAMTKGALAKELMDEVRASDPTQLYFWTRRWQEWEREAEVEKRGSRVVGDGTLKGLLRTLRRR